jgi:hypothetical protein
MAVYYWIEQMDRDTHEAVRSHREELLKMELDRFMDHVLGGLPTPSTLVSRGF